MTRIVLSKDSQKTGFPFHDCHAQSGPCPPCQQLYHLTFLRTTGSVLLLLLFLLFLFVVAYLVFIVPIYDGRPIKGTREFGFSDNDFSKLHTWPLYEQGLQDLPYDAIVSVGYTLNTFGDGPHGGPNGLSTNLHFVILLALPVEENDA